MINEANPRMLAKRIEMERDWAATKAALPFAPLVQTADTVTLHRSDYEAMIRLVFGAQINNEKPTMLTRDVDETIKARADRDPEFRKALAEELIEAMAEAVAYMNGDPGKTVTHTVHYQIETGNDEETEGR